MRNILDVYKYLDKNGLKRLIEKIKKHDYHWTGTHAEYEAQKDSIPAYAILHFTDDYDDSAGVVDKIEDNNMNGVTSNAVYDALAPIGKLTQTAVNATVTPSADPDGMPMIAETPVLEPGTYIVRYSCYTTHNNPDYSIYIFLAIGVSKGTVIGHTQGLVPSTGLHLTGTGFFKLTTATSLKLFVGTTDPSKQYKATGQIQIIQIR